MNREDWTIHDKSSTPKECEVKDCYYLKIDCQPGIYRLLVQEINNLLFDEFKIRIKSGKPERYGEAEVRTRRRYSTSEVCTKRRY